MYTCEGEEHEIFVYAKMFPLKFWHVALKWFVNRDLEADHFISIHSRVQCLAEGAALCWWTTKLQCAHAFFNSHMVNTPSTCKSPDDLETK
jgi:hypothetical protein